MSSSLTASSTTGRSQGTEANQEAIEMHEDQPPDFLDVLYETEPPLARVTINRPQYRNALSRRTREELDLAFDLAVRDDDVRVIILAGAGEHFCSGHDVGTPEPRADLARRPVAPTTAAIYDFSWDVNVANSLRWRDLPKPTIAQVQGYCIYGGWIIASAMDVIVAADDAQFLGTHFQYFSIPWDLPPRKAKEILFRGQPLGAAEARDLGLVNQVVPRVELASATTAMALSFAQLDPFLARMTKFSVNQAQDLMGFRNAIAAAHSNYMLVRQQGALSASADASDKPGIAGVRRALRGSEGTGAQSSQ
jgi:enoyl-CoA hydratase